MHLDTEWRNAVLASLAVHLLLVAAMLAAVWDWPVDRRPNRTGLNIEARIVDVNQFLQQASQAQEQRQATEREAEQRRERERLAQQRDAALQQQREREQQAREQREQEQREQAEREAQQRTQQQLREQEQERQRQLTEQAERERQAELEKQREAERRRLELEARRQAEAERQREQEARRQRELEAIRQQREAAERRRQQEQQKLQQLDDQRQREAEAQLQAEQLAQQQAAAREATNAGRLGSLKEQYIATIEAAVRAAWIRPPSAIDNIMCAVRVVQIPGGEVVDAVITRPCNADSATQRSILAAVKRDDLPYRGFEEVFEREITFNFSNTSN